MSIPFRINIFTKNGDVYPNENIGTISYGSDTEDRQTWIRYFREWCCSVEHYMLEEKINEDYPWFDIFTEIEILGHDYKTVKCTLQRHELIWE